MHREKVDEIPERFKDFLRSTNSGYLSTLSTGKDLSCFPMNHVFFDNSPYFALYRNSRKIEMLEKNPVVAFVVDNGGLMLDALGIQFQGNIELFVLGHQVIDDSHLFGEKRDFFGKFTFIRIKSFRITFWEGYKFFVFEHPKFTHRIPAELLEPLLSDDSLLKATHFEATNDFGSFKQPEKHSKRVIPPFSL
ncbi:MAG: pyridoxamine 5'-phosphate oxidase family protein [Candidatus Odinarchaeota archaeon]